MGENNTIVGELSRLIKGTRLKSDKEGVGLIIGKNKVIVLCL